MKFVNDSFRVEVAYRFDRGKKNPCIRARIENTILLAALIHVAQGEQNICWQMILKDRQRKSEHRCHCQGTNFSVY